MHECHQSPRRLQLSLALLTLAAAGGAAGAAVTRAERANTELLGAESALQAGDCRAASEDYVAAALTATDLKLLQRATEVSLGCGQFALGQKVAQRWQGLAPNEAAASLNLVRAQLARARVSAGRGEWLAWLKSKAAPDDALVAAGIEWLVKNCGSELTYAALREVRHPSMNRKGTLLRMAELANQAFNHAQSIEYGEAALKAGAPADAVQSLKLQALAGLGQADAALKLAEELAATGGNNSLAVAETLMALGRDSEAETELEARLLEPGLRNAAEASLARLQLQRGDFAGAEQHYSNLMRTQTTAAMAVYNLSLIAEWRGDGDDAVRGYELLANTFYDGAARNRIAGIYLRDGEKNQALRMLSAGDEAEPQELIAAEVAQANLLARSGNASEGVTRLDAALKYFPDHPEILYQKAVLLERVDAGAAIALLDAQLRSRPDDVGLANALGYTLADHQRDLGRATQLIARALRAQPDNPAILDSQGWLLYRKGDRQGALAMLQRAYDAYHDGDIGAHLGEVLWSLDRRDEARAAWTRALAADPENAMLAAVAARFVPGLAPPKPGVQKPASAIGHGPGTST